MENEKPATGSEEELPAKQVDFNTAFGAELGRVRTSRRNRGVPVGDENFSPGHPQFTADSMRLIGLCFSGGGIRSATFNLGVLQALAKLGILRHVDYLSTVSGGGYIGAWLNAMIHRADQAAPPDRHGIDEIEPGLNPDDPKAPALPRNAIAYLRAFSNYLTPKVSFLSADTWSLASIWFRNTILNLTILVSGIAALMLAARCFGMVALVRDSSALWHMLQPVLCVAALAMSSIFLGLNVGRRLPASWREEAGVQLLVVCPAVIASILVAGLIHHNDIPPDTIWIFEAAFVLAILFGVFQWLAGFRECFLAQHDNKYAWLWSWLLPVFWAVLSGLVTAWLFHALAEMMKHWAEEPYYPWLLLTVCPPIVLTVLTLGVIVNIGLLGRDIPDGAREWAGRLGAWVMIYSAGWLLFFGAAIYGPVGLQALWGWAQYAVTGAWIASTAGSLFAGSSAKTGSGSKEDAESRSLPMELVALVGPYIFMAGFVVAISLGVHTLVSVPSHTQPPAVPRNAEVQVTESDSKVSVSIDSTSSKFVAPIWTQYWEEMKSQKLDYVFDFDRFPWIANSAGQWYKGTVDLLLLCLTVAILMSWRVDINEFSLNHFYKNRLVRCYLAASRNRDTRNPDPFTKFDPGDDVRLNKLDNDKFSGPFPIVNATLNLSAGRNLAWQERQGASFIFTPIYSGYDTGGDSSPTAVNRRVRVGEGARNPGYWPTSRVSKSEEGGIMMGTAVGISGAAANPNQGYHTSTAVAFLMTVFDVRLGWWLGNPASSTRASWTGPTFGLPYTFAELFGTTDADSDFVSLSDGGHFDNMGLYELIRRRCRYIIVSDAEQDEKLQFGGITNAVRMCRTDFGVEIAFKGEGLFEFARTPDNKMENFSKQHFAVADIQYPDSPAGKLIYIKSSLTGDEPADALGYHLQVPQFPHESTADQWFDESQFESYRRLGQHIVETIFAGKGRSIRDGKDRLFEQF